MAKAFDLKSVLAPVDDIIRRLRVRRDQLVAEVDVIDRELARLGGGTRGATGKVARGAKRAGRKRRSRSDLEARAAEVVQFISDKGKEGATGKEIKAQFGALLPSVNAWLKNYSKAKVRTTGAKAAMRYYAG